MPIHPTNRPCSPTCLIIIPHNREVDVPRTAHQASVPGVCYTTMRPLGPYRVEQSEGRRQSPHKVDRAPAAKRAAPLLCNVSILPKTPLVNTFSKVLHCGLKTKFRTNLAVPSEFCSCRRSTHLQCAQYTASVNCCQ